MEPNNPETGFDRLFVRNMMESALRSGLVFILLVMTYDIIKPFLIPLVWSGIIAIAAFPLTRWLEGRIGGRRGMAASLITLFFILLLVIPSFMLTESLLVSAKALSANVNDGGLQIKPPPAKVAEIPLVGEKLHATWSLANSNLEAALREFQPQLKAMLTKALKAFGSGLSGVLMFVVSLLIAGGFMTYAESSGAAAHKFFVRLGGAAPGGEWGLPVRRHSAQRIAGGNRRSRGTGRSVRHWACHHGHSRRRGLERDHTLPGDSPTAAHHNHRAHHCLGLRQLRWHLGDYIHGMDVVGGL